MLGVYSPSKTLCGFLWALHDEISTQRIIAHVLQLYVEQSYRGLGIASTLVSTYLKHCEEENIASIVFEAFTPTMENMLKREDFTECIRSYGRGPAIALR